MTSNSLPNLNEAVNIANSALTKQGCTVRITNETVQPKEPVFLQLKYSDGKTQNIGIIHLVHLRGDNWDALPAEEIARTTDEVGKAILARVSLFFAAKKQNLYIDESGTIFDFKKSNIKVHKDETFSIDEAVVTVKGKPLPLNRLKSEGVIEFIQMENGHTKLSDEIDQRTGKEVFIHSNGEVYRV